MAIVTCYMTNAHSHGNSMLTLMDRYIGGRSYFISQNFSIHWSLGILPWNTCHLQSSSMYVKGSVATMVRACFNRKLISVSTEQEGDISGGQSGAGFEQAGPGSSLRSDKSNPGVLNGARPQRPWRCPVSWHGRTIVVLEVRRQEAHGHQVVGRGCGQRHDFAHRLVEALVGSIPQKVGQVAVGHLILVVTHLVVNGQEVIHVHLAAHFYPVRDGRDGGFRFKGYPEGSLLRILICLFQGKEYENLVAAVIHLMDKCEESTTLKNVVPKITWSPPCCPCPRLWGDTQPSCRQWASQTWSCSRSLVTLSTNPLSQRMSQLL